MKIVVRGTPRPMHQWANKHWKGSGCGTIVYLEDSDSGVVLEHWDDQRDGQGMKLHCPVCKKEENYYPTRSPVTAEEYYNK